MNRRNFLKTSAMATLAALPGIEALAATSSDRPNILWITMEDTSFFMGCYGDPIAKTPNIDRLGEQGTRFTNAWATASVCSPARSALITGMYVNQLGCGHHRAYVRIPEHIKGFPTYLRQAGYYCTNNSKTDYNFTTPEQMIKESWDVSSGKANWTHRGAEQPFFSVFNFADSHQSRTSVNSYTRFKKLYQSKLTPEEITAPDEVTLPPFYNDTPQMRKAYARMYDCITLVDKQIGALLKKLDDDGLAENTIVFLYTDHGQGMPRFKSSPFGLGYRVPLIIRVPKKFRHLADLRPGTTNDQIVSFVDFGPTVLSLCGLDVPKNMTGIPFLGPKKGKSKDYFFGCLDYSGESEELSRTVSDGKYLYVRNYMPHHSYTQPFLYFDHAEIATYMKQYKKAGTLTPSAAEYMAESRPAEVLYDLKNDPWEINNLAAEPKYKKILERLRKINRQKILSLRDIHFMHPYLIKTLPDDTTASQIRMDPKAYPLEKILETAELTGAGPSVIGRQVKLLNDPNSMIRYWAIIGIYSQDWKKANIQQALLKCLDDPAPYVRYEAAMLCYKYSKNKKAKKVLIEGINEDHPWLVYHAVRKIQLLFDDAAEFIPAINELKEKRKTVKDHTKAYNINCCIAGIENHLTGKYAQPHDAY